MSEAVFNNIQSFLGKNTIKYEVLEHEPTPTSVIAAKVRGTTEEQGAKAMVLRSKGNFFMFVLPGNEKIDLKKAKALLGERRISFATPEEVLQVTDCKVGSVPPFGNLFTISLYVDKSLLQNKEIAFNAGLPTKSIVMNTQKYLEITKAIVENFIE